MVYEDLQAEPAEATEEPAVAPADSEPAFTPVEQPLNDGAQTTNETGPPGTAIDSLAEIPPSALIWVLVGGVWLAATACRFTRRSGLIFVITDNGERGSCSCSDICRVRLA